MEERTTRPRKGRREEAGGETERLANRFTQRRGASEGHGVKYGPTDAVPGPGMRHMQKREAGEEEEEAKERTVGRRRRRGRGRETGAGGERGYIRVRRRREAEGTRRGGRERAGKTEKGERVKGRGSNVKRGEHCAKTKQKWVWLLPRWVLLAGPCPRGPPQPPTGGWATPGKEGSGL